MHTSSSLLLFVLLVVPLLLLVDSVLLFFFIFLALLLLPSVILWKKLSQFVFPLPSFCRNRFPFFSFKMSFFRPIWIVFLKWYLLPLRVSCPLCQSPPLFQMVWPLFLPCQFPLSLIFCASLEKGQKWDAGWLLPFHQRCHAVIHLPTISFLVPSLKSAEKAHHWLSYYFFSFLLFSPLFLYFFKKNKTK